MVSPCTISCYNKLCINTDNLILGHYTVPNKNVRLGTRNITIQPVELKKGSHQNVSIIFKVSAILQKIDFKCVLNVAYSVYICSKKEINVRKLSNAVLIGSSLLTFLPH